MIIVHAFTMIIPVSCPARLMFKEIKDGGPRGEALKKPGGVHGSSPDREAIDDVSKC